MLFLACITRYTALQKPRYASLNSVLMPLHNTATKRVEMKVGKDEQLEMSFSLRMFLIT